MRRPTAYFGCQLCGVAVDDIKVEIRRDSNNAEHLTFNIGGHTAVLTLSNSPNRDEVNMREIARSISRKLTDAVIEFEGGPSPIKRECRVCHEYERLNDDNCCKLCE